MSFFQSLINQHGLNRHDGRPLWKYNLSENDFQKLKETLRFKNHFTIDPRDAALYYAEWWKSNYNGGKPSKQEIFDSLEGNLTFYFNAEDFYQSARKGAQILGLRWIKKQNTLYFRTLLLQGGLPIRHIAENQGFYQDFLLAVLDEQPETIEDFIFKPEIISHLPASSQNDLIYENCFEIVKSILEEENIYDDLLSSNEVLREITDKLRIRKQTLVRRERLSKPQNYWLLNFEKEKPELYLRIGFASSYNDASLSNIFGFDATQREYQFYLNEELICTFRKMLNGNYKTDWQQQQDRYWNGESNLPYAYIIKEGKKIEVKDFIQTIPNMYEPSLWTKHSEEEWRLLKGNGASDKEAAILFPGEWHSETIPELINIYEYQLYWIPFEGEVQISLEDEIRTYKSEVKSFDWTILSQKPNWMLKSSMPVVYKKPKIVVYDENNKALPESRYSLWVKSRQGGNIWQELSSIRFLSAGCIDLKIEKDGVIAYDLFFNISGLQLEFLEKSIDQATLKIVNNDSFEFKLDETEVLDIEIEESRNTFSLKLKTEFSKIPTGVKGSVGLRNKKKLYFEMVSPFEGMVIIDKDGKIIAPEEQLSLANLYGLRILSTPNKETLVRIKNKIKGDVKINKEIAEASYPLISFKEDILRLYYLQDAMDYRNKVSIELIEGRDVKNYEVSLFTHNLNVEEQFDNKLNLYNEEDEIELYAIPLNCSAEGIDLIPIHKETEFYKIPNTEITKQFVVISSIQDGKQLMPRFVNLDQDYQGQYKEERIDGYHSLLASESFEHEIWKQTLAYFNLCKENELPFSTFDQIIAISRSSEVAAKAFFYLGVNQVDSDDYIQKSILDLERDIGFCFHWIKKEDWLSALGELSELYGAQYSNDIMGLLISYLRENDLFEVFKYFNGNLKGIDPIYNSDISYARQLLGERVLNELPYGTPKISSDYGIPISQHKQVKLLLRAPIAVAESIVGVEKEDYPIWGGNEFRGAIRRNIQYAQYLDRQYLGSNFYKRIILQALKNN